MTYPSDIFVSYCHEDDELVRGWLLPQLRWRGLRVIWDKEAFGSRTVRREVIAAIDECRVLMAVVTESYCSSEWVAFERDRVLHEDPRNRRQRFLPCRFDACELLPELRDYIVHDLSDLRTREADLERVLAGCNLPSTPLGTRAFIELSTSAAADLLRSVTVDVDVLRQAFHRLRPAGDDEEPASWNAFECARILALCHDRRPVGTFLQRVASWCDDPATGARIADLLPPEPARGPMSDADPADEQPPICLVLVEPPVADDHADRDAYDVSIHRWWGPRRAERAGAFTCSARDLEAMLPPAIKDALNDLALRGIEPLAVEIVLPVELLCGAAPACVERWRIARRRASGAAARVPGRPLGQRYAVVLRSLDRWEDGDAWLDIGARLASNAAVIARLDAAVPAGRGATGFADGEDPGLNPDVVGVVAGRPLTEMELETVIFAGVPLLVWLREPGDAVDELGRLVGGDLAEAVRRVHERRRDPRPDHVARHVALLHDAERRELPPAADLRTIQPASR